jgi:hypothetical protein
MPRGDKSSYSSKQKRQAEHIEKGYEKSGTSKREAERRAWATVNKQDKGGKKSGSGAWEKILAVPVKAAARANKRSSSWPMRDAERNRRGHEPRTAQYD